MVVAPSHPFCVLLVYHRIALPASTYGRAKGVCLFSFIVPELDPATYASRPADKTSSLITPREGA